MLAGFFIALGAGFSQFGSLLGRCALLFGLQRLDDVLASGLTFGFFRRAGDVDCNVDDHFAVQANAHLVDANRLDRLVQLDLAAAAVGFAMSFVLMDLLGRASDCAYEYSKQLDDDWDDEDEDEAECSLKNARDVEPFYSATVVFTVAASFSCSLPDSLSC